MIPSHRGGAFADRYSSSATPLMKTYILFTHTKQSKSRVKNHARVDERHTLTTERTNAMRASSTTSASASASSARRRIARTHRIDASTRPAAAVGVVRRRAGSVRDRASRTRRVWLGGRDVFGGVGVGVVARAVIEEDPTPTVEDDDATRGGEAVVVTSEEEDGATATPEEEEEEEEEEEPTTTRDETSEASVRDLVRFTLPTMAIWLAEPLLSLVDTSVVGLTTSTGELAAMAPASVYAGYPAYLLATGFAVATTTMIAQDRLLSAKGGADDEDERTVSSALVAAAVTSALSAVVLLAVHQPSLSAYIGTTNSAIVPYACVYSVVRLLALPVAISTAVAQSAFLAVRDPWTPLKAVTLTTVLNLVLDIWFVTGLRWGIGGAAAATSLSQVITMSLLIRALVKRGPEIDKVKKMMAENAERSVSAEKQSTESMSQFRRLRNVGAPALRLPFRRPRDDFVKRVKSIAGPVMVVALIKCIFVGWLVRTATAISPAASAANGVLFSVYFFFAVVGEGVSQASQTFLPPQLGNFENARRLAFRIMFVAVLIGFFNAMVSGLVPTFFPAMFTSSADVIELMHQATPFMSLSLLAHTASMASEGCLLAGRDGVFMSLSYIPNAALSCITLSLLLANGYGVRASWVALFQFHCVRLIVNAVRIRHSSSPLRTSLALGVAEPVVAA